MKHWIIYEKLDTKLAIYLNLPVSEEKSIHYVFKQDLTKKRYYLVLVNDNLLNQAKTFLILTISSKETPSWGKFGPIKCACLSADSYLILNTKILIGEKFAKEHNINLENKQVNHACLTSKQLLNLQQALTIYWKKEKKKLCLLELGIKRERKQ